jgi:hypothetical protein
VPQALWEAIACPTPANVGNAKAGWVRRLELPDPGQTNPMPTRWEVLRSLLTDEALDPRAGDQYAFCLRHLCETFGKPLYNNPWSPIVGGFERFRMAVQEELVRVGVPEQALPTAQLFYGPPPVALPPTDDIAVGYLSKVDVPAALRALTAADLTVVADIDVRDAIDCLQGWLGRCAARYEDLLCFMS